jgi:hypothetical protein
MPRREPQREDVVVPGVAIDDDRDGHAGGAFVPSAPAVSAAAAAAASISSRDA